MNTQAQDLPTDEPFDAGYSAIRSSSGVNVNQAERTPSMVLGGALLLLGLKRHSLAGAAVALAGGSLIYRGVSGRCKLYEALGVNTARSPIDVDQPYQTGASAEATEVDRSITIGKPADELYRLWRDPETLSRVMGDFAEVTPTGEDTQHWRVRSPHGRSREWNSRLVEERPGERLRWWSLEGAELPNEGSVNFRPAPGNRGTEVTLHLRFDPPGGALGNWAVKMLGSVPRLVAVKALHRFKSLAETGEIPTIKRQPAVRKGGRDYA